MTATVEREGGDKPVCVAELRLPLLPVSVPLSSPARRAASARRSPSGSQADGWQVHGVDLADGDLSTREGNRAVVDAALERFGGWLDAVVANAGFQHVAPVRDFPEDSGTSCRRSSDEPVPAREVRVGCARRVRRRPLPRRRVRARSRRLAVQGGLRRREARRARAREGARARRRRGRHLGLALCPGYVRTAIVEAQIADQAARTRPEDGPRVSPAGGEAAARAGGGRRGGRLPARAGRRAPSPARRSSWISAGPPARPEP